MCVYNIYISMPGDIKQLFELSVLQQNLTCLLDWYYWAY